MFAELPLYLSVLDTYSELSAIQIYEHSFQTTIQKYIKNK